MVRMVIELPDVEASDINLSTKLDQIEKYVAGGKACTQALERADAGRATATTA